MGKKIVVLNGSPRRKGNTSELVRAFTEGAEASGNTVTEFFLDAMGIHGCKGCFGGHSAQEHPCVQRDGMDEIYPAVRECDVVVLASPLYYWNMSGQIRTAVDRLFALEEGDGNLLRGHGRSCALLMAAEGHGFEDVVIYFDNLMVMSPTRAPVSSMTQSPTSTPWAVPLFSVREEVQLVTSCSVM